MKNVKLTLNPIDKKSHINREIYSNFSEHLGRLPQGRCRSFPRDKAARAALAGRVLRG